MKWLTRCKNFFFNKALDPNPTSWLDDFRIELTSASDHHYANDKQQIEITLSVRARDSLAVSDKEFASFRVMERNTAGAFIPLKTLPSQGSWWGSTEKNGYDYYASITSSAIDSPSVAERSQTSVDDAHHANPLLQKKIYAMTSASGGTTKQLWAQITKDTGEVYETNFEFVTDITLVAVPIPQYSAPADYSINRTLLSGSESSGIFVYEWVIFPFGVKLYSATMSPPGMIQWQDKAPDETKASYVAFAGPKQASFQHNLAIVTGDYFSANERVDIVTSPNSDKIVVLLQGSLFIPYHSASANNQNGPCTIGAVDYQGNPHLFKIQFKLPTGLEGRTTLELSDAR
jgi:hypothetical protein